MSKAGCPYINWYNYVRPHSYNNYLTPMEARYRQVFIEQSVTKKLDQYKYYNTKYVRLPDLLIDLEIARTDGNYKKVMAKYANPVVLVLDEWLLLKPTDSEQRDIFELLHRRRKKSSTIFCSQYEFEEWYEQLGGDASPLADAIIDRIAHDSYRINITSIDAEHDISMREVYGLDKTLRE